MFHQIRYWFVDFTHNQYDIGCKTHNKDKANKKSTQKTKNMFPGQTFLFLFLNKFILKFSDMANITCF